MHNRVPLYLSKVQAWVNISESHLRVETVLFLIFEHVVVGNQVLEERVLFDHCVKERYHLVLLGCIFWPQVDQALIGQTYDGINPEEVQDTLLRIHHSKSEVGDLKEVVVCRV